MAELRRTYDRRGQKTGKAGGRSSEPIRNRRGRRKQKHRSPAGIAFLLAVLAFLAVCGYVLLRKYGPGRTWADYGTVYGMGAEGTAVFYNGVQAEGTAVIRNDRIYVPDGAASEATAAGISVTKDCFFIHWRTRRWRFSRHRPRIQETAR
ncbi:MAG: hypothetical protein V8S96_05045 [Lachnospiraceae bacterium]